MLVITLVIITSLLFLVSVSCYMCYKYKSNNILFRPYNNYDEN